jgi:tetratricopeptide (TPR) repeat protein
MENQELEEIYENQIKSHIQQMELDKAAELINKLSKHVNIKKYPKLLYYKAQIMLNSQRYEEADKCLDKFLSLKKLDIDGYYLKYLTASKRNRPFEAHYYLNIVLDIDPDNIKGLIDKAIAYMNNKQYELAMKYVEKAIELDVDPALSNAAKGFIIMNHKSMEEGIKYIDIALTMEPNLPLPLEQIYLYHSVRNDFKSALDYVKKALAIEPNNKRFLEMEKEILKYLNI